MKSDGGKVGGRGSRSVREMTRDQFQSDLERRREAATDLEKDLLSEVPMLYGSPGSSGDAGLARIRQDEMRRRIGDDRPYTESEPLPFEGAAVILAFVLSLLLLFAK